MWISLNLHPWFVPPVHFFFSRKKRLSFQLSLGAIACFLLRCAWRFSRDVSNQCRCHGLLSKFQYLDACSWGQQRMEGQGHVIVYGWGQPLVSLNKALLDPYFWGGWYVGWGVRLTSHQQWIGWNGRHRKHIFRVYMKRISWTKMSPTQSVYFCSMVLLVYFTSRCWGIIIPFEFWDFASWNVQILQYLSQSLQTADSCGVSSWGVFRGVSTEIFRSGGIFTFQVGPLGGDWWNKGHSKQVRWRRWIQEELPFFFSWNILDQHTKEWHMKIRWTAKITTFKKRTCVCFFETYDFCE